MIESTYLFGGFSMLRLKRFSALLLALLLVFSLFACGADLPVDQPSSPTSPSASQPVHPSEEPAPEPVIPVTEGASYYDAENVVLYLYYYGELPPNFITKDEARDLGWSGGSVERYLEGAAIGGDTFSNREGLLPKASGRTYTECDLYTYGMDSRGAFRLVFSNDGLYFYTEDHYESFVELYVTEEGVVEWK